MRGKGGPTKEWLVEWSRVRVGEAVGLGVGGSLSVPFLGVRRIPSVLRGRGWERLEIFPLPPNFKEQKCVFI